MDDVAVVRRTPRLSLSERIAATQFGAKAHWPAGFEVYRSGTAADGIFIVLHGNVVLRSPMKGGRGFVSGIAMPGETFGAEGLAPRGCYATDARAADGVETLHLGGEQFRAFVREQPAHAIALVAQVMAERSTLLERLQELASLNVEDRLVSVLLRLSDGTSFMLDDAMLKLDPSHHRLLCEMVGATRESIALALSRMVTTGVATRAGSCFVIDTTRLSSKLRAPRYDEQAALPMSREAARA
ncbi:MAG: Crp/Fnr family transcriptional regulator [Gemmatimonadota bacterium]|nr:Crp/Fnr family transcriptional regulator [Gemmatimonadota bacterium]